MTKFLGDFGLVLLWGFGISTVIVFIAAILLTINDSEEEGKDRVNEQRRKGVGKH